MDNPQDQPGTPGRTPLNPATTPGAAGNSRKATAPNAPASTPAPAAALTSPSSTPASTGTTRLSESPQASAPESNVLDTAVQGGKKWIEDSGLLDSTKQLPQALKDFGNRAVARVSELSTTQKVVGGTLLAVGLGWLATRKGKSGSSNSPYNYGSPRGNNGSYGRRTTGYQAPDASAGRADSGSAYGSGSRYGSTEKTGSGSGFGASAQADHGTQAGFGNKSDDLRNVE